MDIDCPPAKPARPVFPLSHDKPADAVLPYSVKVLNHAHPVFFSVALVKLMQSFTREPGTFVMVPAMYLPAGRDCAFLLHFRSGEYPPS